LPEKEHPSSTLADLSFSQKHKMEDGRSNRGKGTDLLALGQILPQ